MDKAGKYVPGLGKQFQIGEGEFDVEAVRKAVGAGVQVEKQADSMATDVEGLKADFNSLLEKLRTAGIMKQ
ncbi:head fiber protein [Lysinibacillus phage vB_LfM_LysYB1]|nr:head fiber protein [Lysinibacillus phage vB_LfM_LysYB1]WAB25205.1 head fiber protein [Lysinibacillus phage vB_LfM_LysYB2]